MPTSVTYMLMAEDAKRAQGFYRDGLGAKINWAAEDGSWTVMDLGGREVCLHGNGKGTVTDTGLAVSVEDLEQTCAAIERAGGSIIRPEGAEWLAIATDTEGNRICVVRGNGCYLHPSLFPPSKHAKLAKESAPT